MKATLTFNSDESYNLQCALRGPALASALLELDRLLRDRLKYGDIDGQAAAELQAIRDIIPHELLSELENAQ